MFWVLDWWSANEHFISDVKTLLITAREKVNLSEVVNQWVYRFEASDAVKNGDTCWLNP